MNATTTPTMPDGKPAPSVLTRDEACKFLRVDENTFKFYVTTKRWIRGFPGGARKAHLYSLDGLMKFIAKRESGELRTEREPVSRRRPSKIKGASNV